MPRDTSGPSTTLAFVSAIGTSLLFAAAGYAAWGLVEYLIHSVLSHRFRTFVTPLHWVHHREPRNVFTSPLAVLPSLVAVWAAVAWLAGAAPAAALTLGLVVGFARYEHFHWRLHFRTPRNDRERLLREHHLAHHFVNARAYHGVTTRLWDRVFGTLPDTAREDYARVANGANWAPLDGHSNLAEIWNPLTALAALRRARASGRRP